MIEVIQKLDEWTEEILSESTYRKKLFGYCELAKRSSQGTNSTGEQPMPITINGTSDRQYVTIDDRYDFQSYFRTPTPITLQDTVDGEDWAFGFDEGRVQKVTLRWVIIYKVGVGESLIFDFARQLPARFDAVGYQFISINKLGVTIDTDHESIYQTEWGNTVYEKHRTPFNVCVINIPVEYILDPNCEGSACCDDSFLTESGECLIQE